MKALSIHQPYAHLIATGAKRIENRTWPTAHRDWLAIHASKTRHRVELWPANDGAPSIDVADLAFGAVVAVARVSACLILSHLAAAVALYELKHDRAHPYEWVRHDPHASGPWCWVLEDVLALPEPLPYRGRQGLFDLDAETSQRIAAAMAAARYGPEVTACEG